MKQDQMETFDVILRIKLPKDVQHPLLWNWKKILGLSGGLGDAKVLKCVKFDGVEDFSSNDRK